MIQEGTAPKASEELLQKSREILEMVATGRELEDTLRVLASAVESIIPGCYCCILALDGGGRRLMPLTAPGLPEEFVEAVEGMPVEPAACGCCAAIFKNEMIVCEDIEIDPLWTSHRHLFIGFGLRSSWSFPVAESSGTILGCLALYYRDEHPPSKEEVKSCETAAHLAGIAMEAKRSERALKESEERFRLVADYTYDWEYWRGVDGSFIYVSPSCERITGYSPQEFLSDPRLLQRIVHPADQSAFGDHELRARQIHHGICHLDFRIVTRGGGERWISHICRPVHTEDGAYLGRRGSNRDITERMKAMEALRESELRYRGIVEDQTELVCRFLPDSTITFVNDAYCRYFEKEREELVGQKFMPVILEEDREKVAEHFRSLNCSNPVGVIEHGILGPHGHACWQQWTNRVICDKDGHVKELQAVGRDITDRKVMEDKLWESAEKIKFFAYSVSHDLKSPSVAMYGLTKLLRQQYGDSLDERGRGYCDQIMRASEQIVALVEKINLYIYTKESPLELERVKPGKIFQLVRDEFATRLTIRGIELTVPETVPEITADRLSLIRVLKNLVDNALKYGGEALSRIALGYESSEDFHVLSVSDDGIGIRRDEAEKIFEAFQRNETSRGTEGSGLGLAIVKEIAEAHGGSVWIEPGEEKGISFFISISKDLETPMEESSSE